MAASVKVAKAWELAVISKISQNGQYFVGGRETLEQATKLIGLLAQQNQVAVQYEVLGDKFKPSEGTYRVKIQIGNEESCGGGNSLKEAKQAAALQALMTTKYIFEDLPPMLNPAPEKSKAPAISVKSEDIPHWEIYQYEDVENSSAQSRPNDVFLANKRKPSLSSDVLDAKKYKSSNSFERESVSEKSGASIQKQKREENGTVEGEDDEEIDTDDVLCIATIWDFAGKIQVSKNQQYLVGGKELLKESKKLMGILSKQNDIQVEYEAVDDELPLEEGQIMLKVIFGDESYFGSGESVEDAKIAAALQVLLKTDYKFKDLPGALTPAPANAQAGKVITEYPIELDGISLQGKAQSGTEAIPDKPKADESKSDEKKELVADNGQYYVEGETVERQSQYLISTMASQNKILHKYEIIEKCKSSAWVNWIAVRLTLGDETYNGSGESETEAKKAAAMMALQKTKYRFKSQFLPAGLKPTPKQKSSELESLEQGIEKLRRAPENPDPAQGKGATAYLEEMETEKEMDLMMSGVDLDAGTGQFVIDAYVRKACKYLIARLASQNRFSVRYEMLGDKFKPQNKKCRVKLKVKTEEYTGHGPTIRRAKKNASLKALKKTKFTFQYLPNHVKMCVGWKEPVVNGDSPVKSSDSPQTDHTDESDETQSKEESMEVDVPEVSKVAVRKEIDEDELEEGEILDDDEDEEGEIRTPQKEPHRDYRRDGDNLIKGKNSKESGGLRQLSLADLGLPTSFAMK